MIKTEPHSMILSRLLNALNFFSWFYSACSGLNFSYFLIFTLSHILILWFCTVTSSVKATNVSQFSFPIQNITTLSYVQLSLSFFIFLCRCSNIYSNDSKCGVCCVLWRRNQISSPFIPQRRIHFSLSQKKMFCLYNYFHDGCWWWFIMTISSFFKEKKKIENEEEVRRVFV